MHLSGYFKISTLLVFMSSSIVVADDKIEEFMNMSLEDLMEQRVSIVTKSEQALSGTAAAVFVINAEDIRRSGAANIPEALRMAPGLQVTQMNPHDWNVSIRGLNDQASNRILVLVDGRNVYSSLTAGTYWRDLQGIPLETIERIEIIRGTGGTIWGMNSMNGVINIITRSALQSQGGELTAGGGSLQRGFGRFNYITPVGENANLRSYGSYFNVSGVKGDNNFYGQAGDGWLAGARFDWDNKENDKVMMDASWNENSSEESGKLTMLTAPYFKWLNSQRLSSQSGHFLTRWEHQVNEQNHWAIRASYTHNNSQHFQLPQVTTDTLDLDFTHHFAFDERNHIVWGGGYRRTDDDVLGSTLLSFLPQSAHQDLYNAFLQDEITLDDEKRWHFTLGSRFEYYSMTRFEVEPSGSLSWQIDNKHTLWANVSHAIRTPSRGQTGDVNVLLFNSMRDVSSKLSIPVMLKGTGKNGIDAENSTTYQIGWRGMFSDFTADVTAFYANYNDIISIQSSGQPVVNNSLGFPAVIVPWLANNMLYAQSYGAELSLNWQMTSYWRNYLSYSFFKLDSQPYAGVSSVFYDVNRHEKSVPENQISLRNSFNVTREIDFDIWWRYTSSTITNQRFIDDYFNADARIAWRPVKNLELSLVGQNLIQSQHIEYQGDFFMPRATFVPRGLYAKFDWQF